MINIIKNMKKINVVVYGGSFDPPHLSHISVVDFLLKSKIAD
jgi:nicotinic acid mononucleotide adenylyltransferase